MDLCFFKSQEVLGIAPPQLGGKRGSPGSSSRALPKPGGSLRLFARCAGVHVDFHAHRQFDDLRSFPVH
jgi:hypothetical protein